MRGKVLDQPADRAPRVPPRRPVPSPDVSQRPLGAPRILALQRLAGNRATAALLQRQVAASVVTTITRPTLQKGDLNPTVGVLQQKLSVLGEQLVIDADFGGRTQAAVKQFQAANAITPPSGIADTPTWVRWMRWHRPQPDGSFSPVKSPLAPDPTAPSPKDSNVKPVLKKPMTGIAVAELKEKLVAQGAVLQLGKGGMAEGDKAVFDDATDAAVRELQKKHGLGADGVVGKKTWGKLDKLVPGASMGRVDRKGTQKARGFSQAGRIAYDWALQPDGTDPKEVVVRVRYAFLDDDVPALVLPNKDAVANTLMGGINSVWNVFKAVEEPLTTKPRPPVDIEFKPEVATPADVTVVLSKGPGPTVADHYFLDPGKDDLVGIAAHEFGHPFGLQDEYQQSAADHQRQTGQASTVGDAMGDGTPPEQVARELGTALRTAPVPSTVNALAVIEGHKLVQGAFAQRVASKYKAIFGSSVVDDCNDLIDSDISEGPISKKRKCTQPFLYNAPSLMAGAEASGTKHAHAVEPRHVGHIAGLVATKLGGIWNPQRR